jgi:hypothetical protein
MKKFLLRNILISLLIGLLGLWFITETGGQEPLPEPSGSQRTLISSERLEEFAKAYVKINDIIAAYEPPTNDTQDREQARKTQQEAVDRIHETLQTHGLTAETYRKIFTVVDANDDLLRKLLKLIDNERRKAQS